ncbi:MAG: hypothetical protein QOJ79_3420 [Actinomycetota bacterium]|jgi:hypothetical protein|nr:hypothetical protein [Actinomycetota bacterium]
MTAELPVVRLTSPGEIAAALPHLCGFVPTESLVAVSLRGERKRIGLTLRFDLPSIDAMGDGANADEVATRLAHDGASAMVLVVYTDEAGERPRESLVRAVIEAVELRGISVMEGLLVRHGAWSSYTCAHPDCCPPDGTPVPAPVDLLAATAAYDGRVVLRDRDELVASLAAPALLAARAAEQRLDAAMEAWLTVIDEHGREHARADAVAALRGALAGSGERGDAALVVPLQDVRVRDEVATWALDDSEALLSLLLRLARETVAPYDVPVCTLVALVAWVRGDGALANVALDRALAADPSYSMAKLFRAGLDGQLPPSAVKQWLRQTRRTLHPGRKRRAA